MPKVVLTAEDKVAILSAPPGTTHPELARTLGRPWATIAQFQHRVRRAGGWYSAVTLVACAACGRPLVSSYHRRVHRDCVAAHDRSLKRDRQRRAREVAGRRDDEGTAAPLNAKRAELVATLPHGLAVRLGLLPA
jgi:hypothetical protein